MPQRIGPLPVVDVARLVADSKRRVDEMAIVDVRREKRNEGEKKREERERSAPFSLCRQDNLSLKLQPQTSTQQTTRAEADNHEISERKAMLKQSPSQSLDNDRQRRLFLKVHIIQRFE